MTNVIILMVLNATGEKIMSTITCSTRIWWREGEIDFKEREREKERERKRERQKKERDRTMEEIDGLEIKLWS
jgi:hypothetical protein